MQTAMGAMPGRPPAGTVPHGSATGGGVGQRRSPPFIDPAFARKDVSMLSKKCAFATSVVFFGYFVFGFIDNMKGAALPGILDETGFGYADGGNIVLSEYFGFVLATVAGGALADALGKKSVLFLAGFALLAGVLGFAASHAFTAFIATFFMVGVGCGAMELGGNNVISAMYGNRKGRYLNLLACFHGVGSTVAPLFVGRMAASELDWRECYRFGAATALAFLALLVFAKLPGREASAEKGRAGFAAFCRTAVRGPMLCLYLGMFAYAATEIGLATWMGDFLMKEKGLPFADASAYLSIYFGCIMFGRFAGSFVVDRLGYGPVVLGCAAASVATLTLGIHGPAACAALLPVTGLFYAVIFPTLTAMATDRAAANQGMALGVLFCSGGVGSMLGPWSTGMLNERFDLGLGMSVNIVFCVLIAAGVFQLIRLERRA